MFKVVLVDDEQIILSGLQRVIAWEKYGCEVAATAMDGLEGVHVVRRERPDILFTDIKMPNMDGLTMIAALKSEFPHMQIAVLTAFRDFEYAQRAIHLGVTRYLLKPSKMNELEEAILCMTERLRELSPPAQEPAEPEEAPGDEASSFVVQSAMEYIRAHFTEHIRLSDVADNVYVSQWHLSKLIAKNTGQSFSDLLNGVRIAKAKELLADPALKVWEVSDAVGFADVTHFSRIFKKMENMSANEYRNKQIAR